MRIGLVGEAPHDTESIKHLLLKRYSKIKFVPLISDIRGADLENQKVKHILAKQFQTENLDYTIFIRDLDSHENDRIKILERKKYVNDFKGSVRHKCILFLNIYMIEALILADIETFNAMYKCSIRLEKPVSHYDKPKDTLKQLTRNRYKEGHNSKIIKELDIKKVIQNCSYFEKFLKRFEKHTGLSPG